MPYFSILYKQHALFLNVVTFVVSTFFRQFSRATLPLCEVFFFFFAETTSFALHIPFAIAPKV
jgi:hypothetical protein